MHIQSQMKKKSLINRADEEDHSYGSSPDYQNDSPLPQDHFSVSNKGVIREDIVYNQGRVEPAPHIFSL